MSKGQGSMEFLFLIGGVAVVVLIVIIIIFSFEEGTERQAEETFDTFEDVIDSLSGEANNTENQQIEEAVFAAEVRPIFNSF